MAETVLPRFGYQEEQIQTITDIITATKSNVEPKNILEQIMCDADHDYLGRPDYHVIAKKLRRELEDFSATFTDKEWIEYQIDFLDNHHHYYTDTAKNIRLDGKLARIEDLRKKLDKLI